MEKIKPLDLSIFKDFTFSGGAGEYGEKQVCIMSALHLATQIALGQTTLEEAIMSRAEFEERWSNREQIEESDQVECVSETVRDLCIARNDIMVDTGARKEWAMRMMPRIVATNLGDKFEAKVENFAEFLEVRPWLTERRDELIAEKSKAGDWRTSEYRAISRQIRDIENILERIIIMESSLSGKLQLDWLDEKIERILEFIGIEKAKRDKRAATRAANKRRKISPDTYDLGA